MAKPTLMTDLKYHSQHHNILRKSDKYMTSEVKLLGFPIHAYGINKPTKSFRKTGPAKLLSQPIQ